MGNMGFAEPLARVWPNRVIALAIGFGLLVLFVLCLCMGAVSSRADETATRMFEQRAAESLVRVSGGGGREAGPSTIVLRQSPVRRPSSRLGVERLDGRRLLVREPRPSHPELN